MTDWKETHLGEIANISWGDTTKTKAAYTEAGFVAYSASGPDGFMAHFDHEGPGIVLSAIGAQCGKTWFAKGKWSCIKNTIFLKARPDLVDPRFLYFLTANPGIWPIRGAAQPFISQTDARGVSVKIPALPEQRRIASILSAYDDLIENNTRRIAILEEMARRIYEEWFVRFRFPGHENVRMVESELGLVPEGWQQAALSSILQVDKGLSYKGEGLTDSGVPMVNLKNVLPGGGFRRDGTKLYSGAFKERHLVRAGDIVVANTDLTQAGTVVGSPALVPDLGIDTVIFSHHVYAVRLNADWQAARIWVYWMLASQSFKGFAKGHAVGTTVLGLPKEGVTNYRLAVPPGDVVQKFSVQVEPMHLLMEKLHRQIDNLRTTRDLLVPKLISGELDVSAMPEPKAAAA